MHGDIRRDTRGVLVIVSYQGVDHPLDSHSAGEHLLLEYYRQRVLALENVGSSPCGGTCSPTQINLLPLNGAGTRTTIISLWGIWQ